MTNAEAASAAEKNLAAKREHYRLYMDAYRVDVSNLQARSWDAERTAAEFARLSLQSAILLNGGALAALPALANWLDPIGVQWTMSDARSFTFGLLAALVGAGVAYVNFTFISQESAMAAMCSSIQLSATFEGKDLSENAEHQKFTKLRQRFRRLINPTAWVAVLLGFLSFGFFGAGAFGAIDLFQTHRLPSIVASHAKSP